MLEFYVEDFLSAAGRAGIHCTADGEAVDDSAQATAALGTLDLVLHVRLLQPVSLSVVDAESGQPVSGAMLLRGDHGYLKLTHPAGQPTELCLEPFTSPITIQPRFEEALQRDGPFLVGAEGYGWEWVELNLSDGGTLVVELGPCGSLENPRTVSR